LSNYDIQKLDLFSEEEKKHINSIVIKFPESDKMPGHYLRSSFKYALKVYDEMMKLPPADFIYCKGFSGWKLAIEKKLGKLNIPMAVNFHGYEMFQPAPSFKSKIEQLLLFRGPVKYICKQADYVMSYGSKINDVITSIPIPESKIVAIPTGIEEQWLNLQIKPTESKKKFLFIGRYERRKGIEELHAALSKLNDNQDFECHFIGPIPEDSRLLRSNLIYHGAISNQEDIKKITRECDILLCPSYSEGMPNVIMEAMASGLAVIASNVGAVDLLVSNQNGYLLELNELDDLVNIINHFIVKNPSEIDLMKKHSTELIKNNFLWTSIARIHLDFFNRAISSTVHTSIITS
jgi:glycosyltransferase involved in cell wall biosynthesis